jgi:hypothetical protein
MLIHNAEVTGSLNINNVPFNSGSFSGSFQGDGSQLSGVTGATTASYVEYSNVGNKPALVSGSSQIIYSGLSGIPSGIVSSSAQIEGYGIFATTGSNSFNGSQTVTGSLTVTGQVVAQTLNVQQVTSSIVYSSGSNVFGNSLANTQQFTGSVSVTGSLAVNGAGTFASSVGINGSPGTSFPLEAYINNSTAYSSTSRGNVFRVYNSNTGANIFAGIELGGAGSANDGLAGLNAIVTGNGSAALTFYTRDSNTFAERIRLTSGGNVGIGTNSPVGGGGASDRTLGINAATGAATFVTGMINGTRYSTLFTAADSVVLETNAAIPLAFNTNSTERMRITSGGDVFINNSSGVTLNSLTNKLSVSSTTYNLFDISRFSDNAFGPNFYLVKSRNGSIGGNTIVANGDNLGNINWVGANGTGFTDAASIKAEVDGGPGASDMPGRLVFSTTADGATSVTERMRITSGGNIGISTNSPLGSSVERTIHLSDGGGGYATVYVTNSANTVRSIFGMQSAQNLVVVGSQTNTPVAIYTNDTERMRITSGGNVGIGTNNPGKRLDVRASAAGEVAIISNERNSTGDYALVTSLGSNCNNTSAYHYIAATGGADRLYIYGNGNVVNINGSYGTLSDISLKENIVDATPKLADLLQLKVRNFNLIGSEEKQIGFIAQEFEKIFPKMVDIDGKNGMKTIKTSVLVPMLVKAIQELSAKVETLEAEIQTLKQ